MNKYGYRNYYITVMAIKTEQLITESELQYIIYFLVIVFTFTSSKYDVIIYCSYELPPHCSSWVKNCTAEKICIYMFNGARHIYL